MRRTGKILGKYRFWGEAREWTYPRSRQRARVLIPPPVVNVIDPSKDCQPALPGQAGRTWGTGREQQRKTGLNCGSRGMPDLTPTGKSQRDQTWRNKEERHHRLTSETANEQVLGHFAFYLPTKVPQTSPVPCPADAIFRGSDGLWRTHALGRDFYCSVLTTWRVNIRR